LFLHHYPHQQKKAKILLQIGFSKITSNLFSSQPLLDVIFFVDRALNDLPRFHKQIPSRQLLVM
jgi:hypothetical protein